MSDRAARVLAWSVLAFSLACIPAALVIASVSGVLRLSQVAAFAPLSCLTFTSVGAIVASGVPRNAVGWLLLTAGAAIGVGTVTSSLVWWDAADPGAVPGAGFVAVVDGQLWLVFLGFFLPRLMLLFPNGKPPSRRWRYVSWGQWMVLAALFLVMLKPGPIRDYTRYENPLGIPALGFLDRLPDVVNSLTGALFLALEVSAIASVLVRFRHSRGVERTQMKWVVWAVGATAALWIGGAVVVALTGSQAAGRVFEVAGLIGLVLSPVAIGIAVLRYRLYEIDRVISRTLVYGALTIVLGAAYAGLVLLGQTVFSSFAGGSNLAIAVSTLMVAALFLPLRSRVQRVVDRRFYRRRYDAQRTLETFGARLREQVDLDELTAELSSVVAETMQPTHVSFWHRGEAGT